MRARTAINTTITTHLLAPPKKEKRKKKKKKETEVDETLTALTFSDKTGTGSPIL